MKGCNIIHLFYRLVIWHHMVINTRKTNYALNHTWLPGDQTAGIACFTHMVN